MIALRHTADLDPTIRAAARTLLDDAFDGGFAETDWEHALGGMHALAWDGPDLVGHAAVVARSLLHRGRALRTGYVEAVAVRPSHRRQGLGADLMRELDRVVRGAYELGALSAAEGAVSLYASLGWTTWSGPTAVLAPDGIRPTPADDGGVMVLPVSVTLDPTSPLVCDWRGGDVW